ncbi:terminase small subunit [Rummeliibacillus sp. POC4]|uniref:terminase small subunit n=1 Tax=Rummeliibacillus sp. POC4 TaxID=2305899 RepID=UPI00131483D4|nr:terminase small subunit [Rummeliibacillus sp. POC4]
MNKRQKQFVENFLFNGNNGTKAYMLAYENDNEKSSAVRASELLKMTKIRNEIERRQAEIKEHNLTHIASATEILQFYTQVMINPDNKLDQRMKAGEYLGKSMGLFVDRLETTSETNFVIELGDSSKKQLDVIDMPVDQIEYGEE